MKNVTGLNFGQQIVPISSAQPITPQEKADLGEMKKLLDEKVGKDVVSFKIKDPNNIDIVVNHPNPKIEQNIADKLKQIAANVNSAQQAPKAPVAATTVPKPANAGKNLDVVA